MLLHAAPTTAAGRFDAPVFGVRRGRDFNQGSTSFSRRKGIVPQRYWFRESIMIDGPGEGHPVFDDSMLLQVPEADKHDCLIASEFVRLGHGFWRD
jgi:hypothetical protein